MDSNYEAQRQLVSQKLALRRQQAEAERLLKAARPPRPNIVSRLLARLFPPRAAEQAPEKPRQTDPLARRAPRAGEGNL